MIHLSLGLSILLAISPFISNLAVAAESSPPCPVTIANGSTPPGERPSRNHHGNGVLWTVLWDEGTVVFGNGAGFDLEDGSLRMKFPFWRAVKGPLTLEGRNIHEPDQGLRASIPDGYGDTGFQATGLIFADVGCWEVTARAGSASLTFVTRVVNLQRE
jgi:hypothetical protein